MVNIFEFTDFRDYLQRFFEEKKKQNRRYSYQLLARKAGFNNRGFVYNIIKGSKYLSASNCFKLSKALGHTKKEAEYFRKLVDYVQAKSEEERTGLLEQIRQMKTRKNATPILIGKDQYEYLSKWYHSVVRSLIEIFPISDNFELLSKKIFPPITADQAKKSVELLQRLGIIYKGSDGIYHVTGKSIRASDELSQTAVNRFHIECAELAKQSIIYPASKKHLVSSLTLGISEKSYKLICEETMQFKERIIDIATNDEEADRVYQYQLVLFPLTTNKDAKRSGT